MDNVVEIKIPEKKNYLDMILPQYCNEQLGTEILNFLISRNIIREILLCATASSCSPGLLREDDFNNRIKKILGVLTFHESAEIVIDGIWGSVSLSLLINSILNFQWYPNEYQNTNWLKYIIWDIPAEILGPSLRVSLIGLPILIIPAVVGIAHAYYTSSNISSFENVDEDANALIEKLDRYQNSCWEDVSGWLLTDIIPDLIRSLTVPLRFLPKPSIKHVLDEIKYHIIWNGKLTAEERNNLFAHLKSFCNKPHKLTQTYTLSTLANIVEGINEKSFKRFKDEQIATDNSGALSTIKQDSLQMILDMANGSNSLSDIRGRKTELVNDISIDENSSDSLEQITLEESTHLKKSQNLSDEPSSNEQNCCCSCVSSFHANYLAWSLGHPQMSQGYLLILFVPYRFYRLYSTSLFYISFIYGIVKIISYIIRKFDCEKQGKIFQWTDVLQDYYCSVCGDLPIIFSDTKTLQDCVRAYLSEPKTLEQIINFVNRFNLSLITTLDLSAQFQLIMKGELKPLLNTIKLRFPKLEQLYFGLTKLIAEERKAFCYHGYYNFSLDLESMQSIIDFIQESYINTLAITCMNLEKNGFVTLLKNLPNITNVKRLILTLNAQKPSLFDPTTTKIFAIAIQNLTYLNLDTDINSELIEDISDVLTNSTLSRLDMRSFCDYRISAPNCSNEKNWTPIIEKLSDSHLNFFAFGAFAGLNSPLSTGYPLVLAQILPRIKQNFTLAVEDYMDGTAISAFSKTLSISSLNRFSLRISLAFCSEIEFIEFSESLSFSKLETLYLFFVNKVNKQFNYSMIIPYFANGLYRSDVNYVLLGINDNLFSDPSAETLARYLPLELYQIKDLTLANISLTSAGMSSLSRGLQMSSVKGLRIWYTDLSSEFFENLSPGNITVLQFYHSISNLTLFSQFIDQSNFEEISITQKDGYQDDTGPIEMVRRAQNSPLKILALMNTGITDDRLKKIANYLVTEKKGFLWIDKLLDKPKRIYSATNLTYLQLFGNSFGNDGAVAICNVLPYTKIDPQNLGLNPSNINQSIIENCGISSSGSSRPANPYSSLARYFSMMKHIFLTTIPNQFQIMLDKFRFLQQKKSEYTVNCDSETDISTYQNDIMENHLSSPVILVKETTVQFLSTDCEDILDNIQNETNYVAEAEGMNISENDNSVTMQFIKTKPENDPNSWLFNPITSMFNMFSYGFDTILETMVDYARHLPDEAPLYFSHSQSEWSPESTVKWDQLSSANSPHTFFAIRRPRTPYVTATSQNTGESVASMETPPMINKFK